jgi:hypothetical protein
VALTNVRSVYRGGAQNDRVLFGSPVRKRVLQRSEGHTEALWSFRAGERFAIDLWRCNAYGTIQWRCFVCEGLERGEDGEVIPCVTPAVRVLLKTCGAAQSRLFLGWLASLESRGVDLLRCPGTLFEAAHFRLHGSRADRTRPERLSARL